MNSSHNDHSANTNEEATSSAQDKNLEKSEVASTEKLHALDVELDLNDIHVELKSPLLTEKEQAELSFIESFEGSSEDVKAEAYQLPSVLVDEQLLSEIKQIPDRFGFKIGDVADLLGIKQYVLRYWEQEFDELRPKKSSNNHRFFSKKDVEIAFLIRKLLHRDRFSIEGARQALKEFKTAFKKEKDFYSFAEKYNRKTETFQEQLENLVVDINRVKQLFS